MEELFETAFSKRSSPKLHKESILSYELVLPGSYQLKEIPAGTASQSISSV
jgi:hypothetical protein